MLFLRDKAGHEIINKEILCEKLIFFVQGEMAALIRQFKDVEEVVNLLCNGF